MTTLTTSGRDINKKCNENLADKHWLIPPPPTALGNDFYSKHHATNSELTEERCKIVSFRRSRLLLFDNRKNPYEITTISATIFKGCLVPRRLYVSMNIWAQRKMGRRKRASLIFLFPMVRCASSPVTRVSISPLTFVWPVRKTKRLSRGQLVQSVFLWNYL